MDNVKVLCLGAEAYINQIDRIRAGLFELDTETKNINEASHVYCNDPTTYFQALELQKQKNLKLIFNVLDIPYFLVDRQKYDISRYPRLEYGQNRNFNIEVLKEQLSRADTITCICKDVQQQLKEWCGLDAAVIYNPIKDVAFLNLTEDKKIVSKNKLPYKHLFIGRARDPNKRINLCYETLNFLGELNRLAVVGTENPGFGDYLGVLSDEQLNYLLNSVKYLWLPSAFKSIGLPALEAVVTKTIPIVCSDDPAGKEFFEEIELPPDSFQIARSILDEDWNRRAKEFVDKTSKIYYNRFNKYQIARNILSLIT